MKKIYTSLFAFCLYAVSGSLFAQTPPASGFGGMFFMEPPTEQPVSKQQLAIVQNEVAANVKMLQHAGVIPPLQHTGDTVQFGWPLRRTAGFNDPGYYGISNYVDWNANVNAIGDYNCGQRTYDGHRGTDIFTYPFWWKKMAENAVEVVAGADGVIVAKYDGNPDTSCANCNPNLPTCQWNAVFVRSNIDGTIAWYGHLKKGSQTVKAVGASVSKGEFLGVVGSSGNSTGPHLHFEVWLNSNYNYLYDPWSGSCNLDGNRSLWESQQPYYKPGIIKVATAYGQPTFSNCYMNGNVENPKYKDTFSINETVYLVGFTRDNLVGKQYNLKVTRPNGTVQWNWNQNTFNAFYPAAWLYYYYPGTNFNMDGTWKFSLTYEGQTVEHAFVMVTTLPLKLLEFSGRPLGKHHQLSWASSEEVNTKQFVIQRSADGLQFESIGTVAARGDGAGNSVHQYEYLAMLPLPGKNYYRLAMQDKDGKQTYSKIINLESPVPKTELLLLNNPVGQKLNFVSASDLRNASITIIDQMGRVVHRSKSDIRQNQQTNLSVAGLAPGKYYLVLQDASGRITTAFVKQ